MSATQFTAKDAKRMRESRLVFIDWGEDDMSVADLYQTSKRFRRQVLDHNMPARLHHMTDQLEHDIQYLEALLSTFQGA